MGRIGRMKTELQEREDWKRNFVLKMFKAVAVILPILPILPSCLAVWSYRR